MNPKRYNHLTMQIEPTTQMIENLAYELDITYEEAYDSLMEHAPDLMDLGEE